MLSFVIPEDPPHPEPGDQVPSSPDPDEEIINPPYWDDDEEIIDELEYFPADEPVPDLPTEERAVTPGQTRGALTYDAVIPERPITPDPTEFPPVPPRSPNEPLPIDEPETDIPIQDPPADPDDLPGDEPMIDPPPAQASC